MIDRDTLNEVRRLLDDLRNLHQKMERDFKKALDIIIRIRELLEENYEVRRVIEREERFFRDVFRQIRSAGVVRKLSRRLYRFEDEIRREEREERQISENTTEVEGKLQRLQRYLDELG